MLHTLSHEKPGPLHYIYSTFLNYELMYFYCQLPVCIISKRISWEKWYIKAHNCTIRVCRICNMSTMCRKVKSVLWACWRLSGCKKHTVLSWVGGNLMRSDRDTEQEQTHIPVSWRGLPLRMGWDNMLTFKWLT